MVVRVCGGSLTVGTRFSERPFRREEGLVRLRAAGVRARARIWDSKWGSMEPVRCMTCNAVLDFRTYERRTCDARETPCAALDAMGALRFCCRRMYLTHPRELEEHIRSFSLRNMKGDDYMVEFETTHVREVTTD